MSRMGREALNETAFVFFNSRWYWRFESTCLWMSSSRKSESSSHFKLFHLHYFAFAFHFSFLYLPGSSQVCTSPALLVDIIKRSVFQQRPSDWEIELAHSYCTNNCKLVKLTHKRSQGGDVGSECVENTDLFAWLGDWLQTVWVV